MMDVVAEGDENLFDGNARVFSQTMKRSSEWGIVDA
jgi:hypothetical protein